jgi:predicted glycosyltransferase
MNQPKLLFYCQHSLGMGHLVRSFRLVSVLSQDYDVIFINGGPVPQGIEAPNNIHLEHLPPLGMSEDGRSLVSRDPQYSVEQAKQIRQQTIMQLFWQHQPAVILIELFPFGRKKFADELIPLLASAQQQAIKPLVLCSLRDILVCNRDNQQQFDDRASKILNQYFDAVLLHCDPAFATLEEFFNPEVALQIPVYNTGFVAPPAPTRQPKPCERRIVVSAGGGIVGGALYQAAIDAQKIIWNKAAIPMTLVAGPFLPKTEWQTLKQRAANTQGLTLYRTVPGLMPLLVNSVISVSQCGYNTAMELMQSKIKALVVPFQTPSENEQMNRAKKLQQAGVISLLDPQQLDSETLARSILDLQENPLESQKFDTNGAENTLKTVMMLINKLHNKVVAL